MLQLVLIEKMVKTITGMPMLYFITLQLQKVLFSVMTVVEVTMTHSSDDVTLVSQVDDRQNSVCLSRSLFPMNQGRSELRLSVCLSVCLSVSLSLPYEPG